MRRPPPRSTLFPYTTLFRSDVRRGARRGALRHSVETATDLCCVDRRPIGQLAERARCRRRDRTPAVLDVRSEEHTSELQSQSNLVCRLLLEKKKNLPDDGRR